MSAEWVDALAHSLATVLAERFPRPQFATLTAAERKASPHFCGAPGDGPEAFPVPDMSHARAALSRAGDSTDPAHVRACVARVVHEEGWPMHMSMAFSAAMTDPPLTADDTWVVRQGKLFAEGSYDHANPEQRFEFSAADLDAAVAAFAPRPLEAEHLDTVGIPTIFTGKLGTLQRLWRDGTEMHAEVRIPAWVDRVWADWGRKISAVFDPLTKQVIGAGLCVRPRVPDATMMSSDAAAAEAALAHAYALFAAAQQPPTPPSPPPGPSRLARQEAPMADETKVTPAVTPPAPSPEAVQFAELQREIVALKAANATLAATHRAARAREAVTERVSAHRLFPSEVAQAVANLAQAMADDEATPVTFSATEGGTALTRAANLLAEWDARPTHQLTQEQIVGQATGVLRFSEPAGKAEDDPMTPDGAEAQMRLWAARMNAKRASAHGA